MADELTRSSSNGAEPNDVATLAPDVQQHGPIDSLDDYDDDHAVVLLTRYLREVRSSKAALEALRARNLDVDKVKSAVRYERELTQLQIELVKLQHWVQETQSRVTILFEGRDAAGKGGAIRRFIEHLNPRAMRVVALPKPTAQEMGQWYFQRYVRQLSDAGEMVFFDRSWYNRAVVEPVNGFCTPAQYEQFMRQVPEFEHMLFEDGITLIKFWFSIDKDEQLRRFQARARNPLKAWKLSPIDMRGQDLWEKYTYYKEEMFSRTHTTASPWIIVKANNKRKARLESMRYLLSIVPYARKDEAKVWLRPDPDVVGRYQRQGRRGD